MQVNLLSKAGNVPSLTGSYSLNRWVPEADGYCVNAVREHKVA